MKSAPLAVDQEKVNMMDPLVLFVKEKEPKCPTVIVKEEMKGVLRKYFKWN